MPTHTFVKFILQNENGSLSLQLSSFPINLATRDIMRCKSYSILYAGSLYRAAPHEGNLRTNNRDRGVKGVKCLSFFPIVCVVWCFCEG